MAAALTLAACQNDEMPQAGKETQAQFTTNLEQRVQSRMADKQWENADQIGIFTLNDEQQGVLLPDNSPAPSNLRLNMKYYINENKWNSDAPFYFKNPQAPMVQFTAYYPWTEDKKITDMKVENGNLKGTIAIDASDQSMEAQKTYDYLYADKDAAAGSEPAPKTPQGSKDEPNVKFQFAHSMTKVVIKLQEDPGGSTTLDDVEALTPTLKSFISKGTFNLADGKVTAAGFGDTGAVKDLTLANKTTENGHVIYTAILPPQTTQGNGDKAPEIALSNQAGDNYRSAKILTGEELEAGKYYTVTITVKKKALVIDSTDITDWLEGDGDSSDAVLQ